MEKIRSKIYNILRKSEKYTQTDMVYLSKGLVSLSTSQILLNFLSFLLLYVYANFLTKEDYGLYKYILSSIALILSFSLTGISTAVSQSIAAGFDSSLIRGFKYNLKNSSIFILIALTIGVYYLFNQNTILGYGFILSALLQPLISSSELFLAYYNGKKYFYLSAKYQLIKGIFVTILILATTIITKNLLFVITVYFLSHFISSYFFYLKTKRSIPNTESDFGLLHYSTHLSFANLISNVANYFDKILVFHFLGSIELASYAIATAIPDQIKALIQKIGTLLLPKFTQQKQVEKKIILKKTFQLLIVLIFISVIYIYAVPIFFTLLLPQYVDTIYLAQLLGVSICFNAIIPKTVLEAKKQIKLSYISKISSGVARIIILSTSLALGGLVGLIIGRNITRLFDYLVSLILVLKIKN